MNKKRVILLKGGISSEREVSLRSGGAVETALVSLGWSVRVIDVTEETFCLPEDDAPVFICLHGTFGEDGTLQKRLLDEGRIFTGTGPEGCRCAFNKLEARARFVEAGLRVAAGGVWHPEMVCQVPFVLKPVSDGSSVGVFIVDGEEKREMAESQAAQHGDYLFEERITGREVTVGVLGKRALPVVEVRPQTEFYNYDAKYTPGQTEHLCPAPLDEVTTARLQEVALVAHRSVGCEVVSRVDFILPDSGEPVCLEVNTIPGMTEMSLLPEAAAAAGISFPDLCESILQQSLEVQR